MRAACGCLVEDGMVLHGYDGPCTWERTVEPTIEDHCGQAGHNFINDDAGVGRCYCGLVEYPAGGPTKATT